MYGSLFSILSLNMDIFYLMFIKIVDSKIQKSLIRLIQKYLTHEDVQYDTRVLQSYNIAHFIYAIQKLSCYVLT